MAFEGYVEFGGNELVNTERARGYTRTADCAVPWVVADECSSLVDALGEQPYTYANISDAPWYDPSLPDVSGRFLGVVGLDISGVQDSTRVGGVIEGIDDGGVMSRIRKGARQVRVTATLIAQGGDALEYGIAWLSAALDPGACGQHGTACGTTDMSYFVACPPMREPDEAFEDYQLRVDPYRRYLHGVAATSGPLRLQLMKSQNGTTYGATMEWTITSERPWIYGVTHAVDLPTTTTTVIDDTPFNLVPYPSAEAPATDLLWDRATGPVGAKITVPTHVSPQGGQATHPSVVDFGSSWNGYRYWMAMTPYPAGNDSHEDPNIVVSANGTTWVVPPGLTNPLDNQPGSPGAYNSDTELVLGPDGQLWLMWRTYDPAATGAEEKLYVRKSLNGVTWSAKQLVYQSAASARRLVSPSLIWENGGWTMYAVDILPTVSTIVRLRSEGQEMSTSGWTAPVVCSLSAALPSGRKAWHIEVRLIDGKYVGMLNDCTSSSNGSSGDLYMITSTNGTSFTRGTTVAIPRAQGSWHTALYRATFVPGPSGQMDVWYAGWVASPSIVWNLFKTTVTAPGSGSAVTVGTNYSLNPSVESNSTGWTAASSGLTPSATGARSTDIASVGSASFKATTTATNSGTNAILTARQDVSIAAAPAGARFSINMWSTLVLQGGTAVLSEISTEIAWLNSSGTQIGSSVIVGTRPPEGGPASVASLVPPAGAVTARVSARGMIASWSVGAVISLYADALAVTVP